MKRRRQYAPLWAPPPPPAPKNADRLGRGLHFAAALTQAEQGSPLVVDLAHDPAAPDLRFLLGFASAHGITGAA